MVKVTRVILAASACAIALGALGAGLAQAQQVYNIDHYLVYRDLAEPSAFLMADLMDQFGPSMAVLMMRDKFANPVDKTHPPELPNPENIRFPYEHLSWWRFMDPWPYQEEVRVSNQFGSDQPWILGPAEYLLVPAIKGQMGEIMVNQHYQCYVATDAPDIQIPVWLMDQFGLWPDVFVLGGRYLCNPVEKLGPPPLMPSGPPVFPEDHLACYDIPPWPVDEIRMVTDQVMPWGEVAMLVEAQMLCVPSSKERGPLVDPAIPTLNEWGLIAFGMLLLTAMAWALRRRQLA
jgi:hypothetical protein